MSIQFTRLDFVHGEYRRIKQRFEMTGEQNAAILEILDGIEWEKYRGYEKYILDIIHSVLDVDIKPYIMTVFEKEISKYLLTGEQLAQARQRAEDHDWTSVAGINYREVASSMWRA